MQTENHKSHMSCVEWKNLGWEGTEGTYKRIMGIV